MSYATSNDGRSFIHLMESSVENINFSKVFALILPAWACKSDLIWDASLLF